MSHDIIASAAKKVQEHADALYELVRKSNPNGNGIRAESEEDKRCAMAMWHGHEVSKYLFRISHHNNKLRKGE